MNKELEKKLKELDIDLTYDDKSNESEKKPDINKGKESIKIMAPQETSATNMNRKTKKRSIATIVRSSIFAVSLITAIFCIILIVQDSNSGQEQIKQDEINKEIKEAVELTGIIPLDAESIERVKTEVPSIMDKYVSFYDTNPDLVGWLKIGDSKIDYPVVQNNDNEFYLTRDFYKNESTYGAIFADYHVKLKPNSRPNNTVLYGHNIADGSYFASLTNYYPPKYGGIDYYLKNPTITFDTLYEEGTYKIFAAMFINTMPEHDNGNVYEYYRKRTFKDRAAFYDFAVNVMDRSVIVTDVDLEYGDEILTLSTCYYPLGNHIDARFVVFARRVREGESKEVDTGAAYINPSPLYFDTYYKHMGLSGWQGRGWDTSFVKGLDEFLAKQNSD